jgi:hypothetical protein
VEILDRFARHAPFPVKVFHNERNLGSTLNFEKAIGLCSEEIIALSDQDDVWMDEKLARFEELFHQRPEVGLIFSDADLVDQRTSRTGETLWARIGFGRAEAERFRAGKGFDQLLKGSTVTGATLAFRARFKELVLPIPNDLSLIHDSWIALLLAAVTNILPLNEPLVLYRKHEGQQVGPLERQVSISVWEAIAQGKTQVALRRSNPYFESLTVARRVRERLLDKGFSFKNPGELRSLEGRIVHLEARSGLPRARLKRAGQVLRELVTFRYNRYSNGLMSAFKDIVS